MSLDLRIVLVFVSLFSFVFIVTNIRKSKVKLDSTFYWVCFSIFVLVLSIFPEIADWGAKLVGIVSPVNFILLVIIFLLLYKTFSLTLQLSRVHQKLEELVQNIALQNGKNDF